MTAGKTSAHHFFAVVCFLASPGFLWASQLNQSIGNKMLSTAGQLNLIHDMLESYDRKVKPTWDKEMPINVTFSMDLYQILKLNEPQQYILLNAWIIERWYDEFLYWNPLDYSNITELRLPYDVIWMPDTTLYNSLVMKDDETRRLLNAKLTTNTTRRAVLIDLLYPAIFKFSCLLTLRYFPYDLQVCTMTFSSWTYDQKGIDYYPYASQIGTSNFLENEGWYLLQTSIKRKEVKYSCCPNNYTLLKLTLYLRRKPLFYLINLIIPTSIITLIAIVGFFTTSSASGMREEKVSLGITTLLSMSILMLMVSDQMPTTSTFIPLIGWFILCTIILISLGTLASTIVIAVQKRGRLGERLSQRAIRVTRFFGCISITELPHHLRNAILKHRIESGGLYRAKSANLMTKPKAPSENTVGDKCRQELSNREGSVSSATSRLYTNASVSSRFSQLFSCLRHQRANDRLATDKSIDLLVMKEIGDQKDKLSSGSAMLVSSETNQDDVFRFSPTYIKSKVIHKCKLKGRSPEMGINGGILSSKTPIIHPLPLFHSASGNQQRQEMSGISALITANILSSSAVAVPSNLQGHGVFEDSDAVDEASELEALTSTVSRFGIKGSRASVSGRSDTVTPSQLIQQARVFNENIRQNRLLAQKEYEWVATVLERCCFFIFVIVFFLLTLGINFIGYHHWSDIEGALLREGDERHI